jgi:hypothetical protein
MNRLRRQLKLAITELETAAPIELADRAERIWKAYARVLRAMVDGDEPRDDGQSRGVH